MPRIPVVPVLGVVLGLAVASGAQAGDVLLIDRVEATRSLDLPRRGESMSMVENRFGAPSKKHAAVGGDHPQRPPITRWDYTDFSVYFEHQHVVDAVLRRASPDETGPKPIR